MVALTAQIILAVVSFLASCLAIVAAREVVEKSAHLKEDMEKMEERRISYCREINEMRKVHYALCNQVDALLKKT